ncbi:MAG: RlpA-like double-psi beta-barrel domain-containing protein [Mycobacteriales bacterium]
MHVRRLLSTAALAVAAAAAFPCLPGPAQAAPSPKAPLTSADLPRLTAELARVTQHAEQLSDALERAAAQDGGLRVAYARLDDARYAAQEALDISARHAYMANDQGFSAWQYQLAAPSAEVLARRAQQAGLTVDQDLVDAVSVQKRAVAALQKQADAYRLRMMAQAQAVLAEEEAARELYLQAKAIADAEHLAAVQAQLEAQRELLDNVSTHVTLTLTPAQTARAKRALESQAPIVALLERSGGGIPEGYQATGITASGIASWYGPGFVGRPTASGAPYDPERLTCANKELPLGTVIHVTANGYAVNCLVNDRGPYIAGRILDMSRAGSRALGYSGLAEVTIEVLTPL